MTYRFFPLKKIDRISIFQDIGPLKNNLLILVLSEVAAIFLLAKEPDFIVLLASRRIELSLDYSIYSEREYKINILNRSSELILDITALIPSLIVCY